MLALATPVSRPGNEADDLFFQFHTGKISMWQLRQAFAKLVSPVLRGQKDPFGAESVAACKHFLANAVPTSDTDRKQRILNQANFDIYRRASMFATLVNVGIRGAYKQYMSRKIAAGDLLMVLEPESRFVRQFLAPGIRRTPSMHKRCMQFAEVARSVLDAHDPDLIGASQGKLHRPVLVSMVARIEFIDRELINKSPL